ncbi:hypothetical protein NMY22_g13371 [Coprinellus aureogranulatus]|nr:hypothetical protein NMY22_g13371 [Coprinellus aureogranulatus]
MESPGRMLRSAPGPKFGGETRRAVTSLSMSFLHVVRRSPLIAASCRSFASTSGASTAAKDPNAAAKKSPAGHASIPQSSCPEGTLLKGLNYLKGQAPIIAKPESEYPAWLWTILKPKEYPDDGPGGKAERVARKKERQQAIKDRNFMSTQ